MNCRFDQELLTGYYDGELDDREKSSVEQHIAACSHCLRLLSEVKDASVQVRTLPRVAAPASVREAVARQVRSPLGRARVWFNAAVAAAALVLVSVSVILISTRENGPAPGIARVETRNAPKPAAEPATSVPNAPPANALKDVQHKKESAPLSQDADGVRDDLRKLQEQQKQMDAPSKGGAPRPGDDAGRLGGRWAEGGEPDAKKAPEADRREAPKDEKPVERKKAEHNEADDAEAAGGKSRGDDENRKNLEEAAKFKAELEKKSKNVADGKADKSMGFAAATPAVPIVRVKSADLGKVRSEIDALVKEFRGAKSSIGAAELGSDSNVNDRYLTLELSDAEYEALQKHLASLKSVEVAEGSLDEERERTMAWRRQLRGGAKEPAAEEALDKEDQLSAKELKEKEKANDAVAKKGPGATPPPAPAKPSADPAPAEKPADPAAPDQLKRDPTQGGGGAGGAERGRTKTVARKRYILVFEEKPKK
jgi:hypothetical protein